MFSQAPWFEIEVSFSDPDGSKPPTLVTLNGQAAIDFIAQCQRGGWALVPTQEGPTSECYSTSTS